MGLDAFEPSARRGRVLDLVRDQAHSHSDAFYVVDLAEVARKHSEWMKELGGRVRPYYAVKCNDDPKIVATLASLGAGFDCASRGEMSMVLGLGVPASDIIFAHPAKQPSHITYAQTKGVTRMTFDNADELRKIAATYPGAEVVLRILTDDSASVCRLGLKFGAPLSEVKPLLELAKELNLTVAGISYHVGSGNGKAESFGDAVRDARAAFNIAESLGMKLRLLDIGGGFPGSELGAAPGAERLSQSAADATNPYSKHPTFRVIASHVRAALDKHFPDGCGVEIIAEPGRFFVKSSHVLAVNVVGKRLTMDEATNDGVTRRYNYYVNDGLYGSFNCIMYDHVTCAPSLLMSKASGSMASLTQTPAQAEGLPVDDAIVRLGPEGLPLFADAVGEPQARELGEVIAATAAALQESQAQQHRVVMGADGRCRGLSESDSNIAASGGISATNSKFIAAAASYLAGASNGSTKSQQQQQRRSMSHTSLATGSGAVQPTSIWGPTCDSIDKISDDVPLPELSVGDWLVYENMGAYTIAGSCKFNGFPLATKVYIETDGSVSIQKEAEFA
jgi:diaminopimelate decarboxylase